MRAIRRFLVLGAQVGLVGAQPAVPARGQVALGKAPVQTRFVGDEGQFLVRRTRKAIRRRIVAEAFHFGFVAPEDGNPGRDATLLEQGVVHAAGIVGIGNQVLQRQALCEQPLLQLLHQLGQVDAVAAVGKVGLHVADHAVGRIDRQAAEVVERPRFARLDGDARVWIGRAVVGFVADQTCPWAAGSANMSARCSTARIKGYRYGRNGA